MVFSYGTGNYTDHLASESVGNARNRCIIPWFTPTWDSHMKVMPIVTVQNVFRVRGFGSMLQQDEVGVREQADLTWYSDSLLRCPTRHLPRRYSFCGV